MPRYLPIAPSWVLLVGGVVFAVLVLVCYVKYRDLAARCISTYDSSRVIVGTE
jgi:hypothetical protein